MEDRIISEASEASHIADMLIPQYHLHLLDARILYLFTTQTRKKCDRVRLASAQKFSDLQRFLSSKHLAPDLEASIYTGADFLILIGRTEWDGLTSAQRRAVVDHELSHCGRIEKITDTGVEGRWAILGHDLEEFTAVIQRHGLWRQEARDMARTMTQLAMDFDHRGTPDIDEGLPHQSSITRVTMRAGGESFSTTPEDFSAAVQRITGPDRR